MVEAMLWLSGIEGLGPKKILELAPDQAKLEFLWNKSLNDIMEAFNIDAKFARKLINTRVKNDLHEKIHLIKGKGIHLISYFDERYPYQLKEIHDPPVLLFCIGNMKLLETEFGSMLGVVGTRKPTPYGVKMTESITKELASAGVTIVSGLARGIDAIAHNSCVESYGKTIAVLGCGCDVVYPKRNRYIYEGILSNGGLIMSEFLPGTQPLRHHFPKRNRIISGLSAGVLVMEAGENSGSLITAKYALDQGRFIMTLPGNVSNPMAKGSFKLLKEGAVPIGAAQDVLDELEIMPPCPILSSNQYDTSLEKALAMIEPATADQISALLGEDVYDIMLQLTILEMAGKIKRMPGGLYLTA